MPVTPPPLPPVRLCPLRAWGAGIALVTLVVLAYLTAIPGQFLWDDDLHITANATIVGPLGLKEIWTTSAANYFPLVLTNFWAQHALWGLNPMPYHLVTLGFHALCALLLWRVLARLSVPGAWLGAALWALHPVQVESVAWICELKNTQSCFFFLLAIWFYVRWLEVGQGFSLPSDVGGHAEGVLKPRPAFGHLYALALFCAVLAILSKPSTVMLPPVLGLIAWWRRGRLTWRDAAMLAPFFALSALAAGWTIWEQQYHSGAIGPAWAQTRMERVLIAGHVLWFYLWKLAWPHPLMFIYPRWEITATQPLAYVPVLAAIALVIFLWWRRNGAMKPVFIAALYFGVLLFPVLGFFKIYFFRYSFVGDHFQYLASIGPLVLAGAGLTVALKSASVVLRRTIPAALVLVLTLMTTSHGRVFVTSETLWRDTVAKNPTCIMAWLNLADYLGRQDRHEESITTFKHATSLAPNDPEGFNDLGAELLLVGRPAEAFPYLEKAIRLRPDYADAHNALGSALRDLGRRAEAMAYYERAVQLDPALGSAHNNLGCALAETGRSAEALPHFETALRAKPNDATARANLGDALAQLGRGPEALAAYERVLALRPDWAAVRGRLALVLFGLGRSGEAFAQLEKAVKLSPQSAEAQINLGVAFARADRGAEALKHFAEAVRLDPKSVAARGNLATALASAGRWAESVPHWTEAARLVPDDANAQRSLGVALVNSQRLAEAVPSFERALQLAPDDAQTHQQFGEVLRALGRNREALEHFEAARKPAKP